MKYSVGVDLGGTNIAAGIVDENGKIVFRGSVPTDTDRDFDKIMEDMGNLINKLILDSKIPQEDIKSIGIGAPGVLDNELGTVYDNSNIHWEDYPIRAKLQQYTDKPIFLGNDANVAAWAEFKSGCGKGTNNFIMLTLGTGVGGGIVINNQLITGSHNIGAEIGHVALKSGGELCGCGNRGCIEAYCSATALIKMAKKHVCNYPDSEISKASHIEAKTVVDAYINGDELGTKLFNEYVDNLAHTIGSLVNFLDPDVIALGGGVANAGETLLKPLRERFPEYVTFKPRQNTKVLKAEMGNDAGIVGAAMLGK